MNSSWRLRLLISLAAIAWASVPLLVAVRATITTGQLPYSWHPWLAAAPGLFVLEDLLGFRVPLSETHWTTGAIIMRALIFTGVNALFWAGMANGVAGFVGALAKWRVRCEKG